ncbi:molybdopterin-dependent oxidoreductase [Rhodococcus jostii]|uniref:molybdopterin-dependent oxidoreductase n=1 Tax=Rhodococcus jostii TaxID=132919 RepID=UPI003981A4CE
MYLPEHPPVGTKYRNSQDDDQPIVGASTPAFRRANALDGCGAGGGVRFDGQRRRRIRWQIGYLANRCEVPTAESASPPQGRNEVAQRIPVARVEDMMLNPGAEFDHNGARQNYLDIRLVYWIGGNPFRHHQDLHRLVRAWRRPETVITHESWWTPLSRFSDVVFPVATSLKRNDIAIGQLDMTLAAMHRVREAPPGGGTDFDVFAALTDRLGYGERFTEGRSADERVRELYARTKEESAREGVSLPEFWNYWRAGSSIFPNPGRQRTGRSDDFAPIRSALRYPHRRARSRYSPRPSQGSATTTARVIRCGWSPKSGRVVRVPPSFRCTCVQPAEDTSAQSARSCASQPTVEGGEPRAGAHQHLGRVRAGYS